MDNLTKLLAKAQANDYVANQKVISSLAAQTGLTRERASAVIAQAQGGMPATQKSGYVRGIDTSDSPLATISFSVERPTAAIDKTLFIPIGNPAGRASQYRDVLYQKGIGYVGLTDGYNSATAELASQQTFTFTEGADTDTVVITSDTYNVNDLLQSFFTNMYRIEKLRISCSNESAAGLVFQKNLEILERLPTGNERKGEVPVTSSFSPDQQQTTIVDVAVGANMSPSNLFLVPVVAFAGLKVTYTFFISRIDRLG